MKYIFSLLFVFMLGITQTSVAVDSYDEQKPQVEKSKDIQDVSTQSIEVDKSVDVQKAKDRLDKLFDKAEEAFDRKYKKHYDKLIYSNIIRNSIKEYKSKLLYNIYNKV